MNLCIFSGRITKDAETRHANNGTAITSFTLAVDSGFGERKRTDFISCKAFKREAIAQYLTKGNPIMVSGEYQEEKWEKDGQKHSRVVILCRDIDFQQGDRGQQQPAQEYTGRQEYSAADMGDSPF